MNILQYKQALKHGYEIKRPVCALSTPGLGKSSAALQHCQELSKELDSPVGLIEIRGASSNPAELATVKYVSGDMVKDADQDWVPTNQKVKDGLVPKHGYIFCDELTASPGMVQSTLQRLFLDRKLGNLDIADGWMVTAAGNRAKDKSASKDLSRAFANRCIMVTVDPDPDVFFDWGLKNSIDHRVLAFVRFRPSCVNDGLEIKRLENIAFCSPRSLHMASDSLKAKTKLPEALQHEVMTGILGDGVGNEFNGFLRIMNDLPDLDKILKDPKNYPVPTKIDVAWATIGALSNRVNKKNMQAIMQYFVRLSTELSVVAIKDLAKIERDIFTTPEFVKWSSSNIKFAV